MHGTEWTLRKLASLVSPVRHLRARNMALQGLTSRVVRIPAAAIAEKLKLDRHGRIRGQ